jgi:hypothetical protein
VRELEGIDPSTLGDPTGQEVAGDLRRWAVTVVAHPEARCVGRRAFVDTVLALGRTGDALGPDTLQHARVSRDHALIERLADGSLQVVDRGSHNGTTVNGARVGGAVLATGDVIGMGPILLLVHQVPPPVPAPDPPWFDGTSAMIAAVGVRVQLVARRGEAVLVTGEAGTGKSRLARAIAAARPGPTVVVEAATLSGADAASALHERVREASGGTLVVEALDRAPRELASVLDRILDGGGAPADGSGSAHERVVAVRVIATACDTDAIPMTTFTRLGWRIALPPLRERLEDVPSLVRAHVGERPLHHAFVLRLLRDVWAGNVRELFQVLDRASAEQPGDAALRGEDPAIATPARVDVLTVARDGTWFAPPDGDRVPLGRRGNLARLVAALARRRAAEPGATFGIGELLEIGWPGERLVERTGANRVHVALTSLRNLGLRDVIERVGEGYRLTPKVAVQLVDPSA